jgi:hypothetical protein
MGIWRSPDNALSGNSADVREYAEIRLAALYIDVAASAVLPYDVN